METQKKSGILKWTLIIAIMVVVNLFFNYAIAVFYDKPEYTNFCEEKQVMIIPDNEKECVADGGQWTENRYPLQKPYRGDIEAVPLEPLQTGYCDVQFECRQAYGDASELYDRNVFVLLVVVGVGLLIGSTFIVGVEAVAVGLSFGGVLSLIIGTMRYWSNMDESIRVIVLGFALAALIWLGIKKFKD